MVSEMIGTGNESKYQVRENGAGVQNRSALIPLIFFMVLILCSHLSVADILFVPTTDTYPGRAIDYSSCTNPPQTINFEYSTLDAVLQLYLRTKVSASNCSTNQVWRYDYLRTNQIGPSSWEFVGRSQYDGSIAVIGNVTARHNCPGQPNVGSLTCPITCPSDQLMINGQCQQPKMTNSSCVGNPVVTATGNKIQIETDYLSKVENGITFKRIYNSLRVTATNSADYVWRHNYDHQVLTGQTLGGQALYIVNRSNSNYQEFIVTSNGLIPRDADITDRLIELKNASGVRTGWQYTTADNDVEIYNVNGKLLSITDHDGQTQTLTYSDANTSAPIAPMAGLLIRVTDAFGRQLNLTYNSGNRIATMTDPAGGLYSYGYDTTNNLTSVTYPDLKIRIYLYNEPAYTQGANLPNALTGIIDENGLRYATYQYDANGKAISTEHAGGVEKYSLAYSADGTSTTVTDPLGSTRTTTFTTILGVVKPTGNSQPGGSGCSAASNNITYDVNGNVASRTGFNGNRTNYIYDLTRNLETSRTEGLTAAGANTPQTRTIITEWHPTFRLPTKITEPGLETTYTYDTKGNITLNSLKDLVTNKTRNWTSSYTYSATGISVQKVDDGPRTDVSDLTTYDYYPEDTACTGGHFGCRGQLKQVIDTLGHITSLSRYSAHGQPELITDPNGLTLTMVYDVRQRLTSLDSGGELTSYRYDPAGQLIRVTQPNNAYLDYTYDNAHRLTDIKDQLGNTRHYTLDNKGNRTKDELFDPNGQLARSQSRVYDALSRLQNLVLPQ